MSSEPNWTPDRRDPSLPPRLRSGGTANRARQPANPRTDGPHGHPCSCQRAVRDRRRGLSQLVPQFRRVREALTGRSDPDSRVTTSGFRGGEQGNPNAHRRIPRARLGPGAKLVTPRPRLDGKPGRAPKTVKASLQARAIGAMSGRGLDATLTISLTKSRHPGAIPAPPDSISCPNLLGRFVAD